MASRRRAGGYASRFRSRIEYDRRAMALVHRLAVDLPARGRGRRWPVRQALLTACLLIAASAPGSLAEAQERLHEGRPLGEWAGDLEKSDAATRRRAAAGLAAFGGEALGPLSQA